MCARRCPPTAQSSTLAHSAGRTFTPAKRFSSTSSATAVPWTKLLPPHRKDITLEYERGFVGMTDQDVSLAALLETREAIIDTIIGQMPDTHRQLIVTFVKGETIDWSAAGFPDIEILPAIQWRRRNLDTLSAERRNGLADLLEKALKERMFFTTRYELDICRSMNQPNQPIETGQNLQAYERCLQKWRRWLRDDPHHALWPQIYSMLLADMTFRAIAAVADADPKSALHSPILMRAIVTGYASDQALSVRRLVDMTKGVISLRKLVGDLRNNLSLMTRENFVCAGGHTYDGNPMGHLRFDRLTGIDEAKRRRDDRIPRRLIIKLDGWLDTEEINAVKEWSNARVAHTLDLTARSVDPATLTPTAKTVAMAQRRIVRTAEAVSAYLLGDPAHLAIVPVFQYSQFHRFEMLLSNPDAMKSAHEHWHAMAEERDQWTAGLIEELTEPEKPVLPPML